MAKKKFEIMMQRCRKCQHWHATFWKSTPPPSCDERRLRAMGRKLDAPKG